MNNHPIFKNVDISKYQNKLFIRNYPQDSLVFSEDENCLGLGIILSGQLTISTLSNNDKEYTINIIDENDIFGENLLFTDNNKYLGDGIATKNLRIIIIKKELLLEMFSDKIFLENYLHLIANKNTKLRQRLKLLSQKTIEDRIMFYLYSEQKRLKTKTIPILNKEILANTLNIPRPSLSRELIKLKEKGLIDYAKYFIKIL